MKRSLFKSVIFPLGLTLVSLSLFAQEVETQSYSKAKKSVDASIEGFARLLEKGEITFKNDSENQYKENLTRLRNASETLSELSSVEHLDNLILDLLELKDFLLFYLEQPTATNWYVKTNGVIVDLPKKSRIEKIFIKEGLMGNFQGRDEKDQIFTEDKNLIWKQAQIVSVEFKKRFVELRTVAPKRTEVKELQSWIMKMGNIFKDRSEAPAGMRILLDK